MGLQSPLQKTKTCQPVAILKPAKPCSQGYAERWGYEYEMLFRSPLPDEEPQFGKLQVAIDVLDVEDPPEWFLWLDCDALVTNRSISLDDLLMTYELREAQFVVAEETSGINSGIFLVKGRGSVLKLVPSTKDIKRRYTKKSKIMVMYEFCQVWCDFVIFLGCTVFVRGFQPQRWTWKAGPSLLESSDEQQLALRLGSDHVATRRDFLYLSLSKGFVCFWKTSQVLLFVHLHGRGFGAPGATRCTSQVGSDGPGVGPLRRADVLGLAAGRCGALGFRLGLAVSLGAAEGGEGRKMKTWKTGRNWMILVDCRVLENPLPISPRPWIYMVKAQLRSGKLQPGSLAISSSTWLAARWRSPSVPRSSTTLLLGLRSIMTTSDRGDGSWKSWASSDRKCALERLKGGTWMEILGPQRLYPPRKWAKIGWDSWKGGSLVTRLACSLWIRSLSKLHPKQRNWAQPPRSWKIA